MIFHFSILIFHLMMTFLFTKTPLFFFVQSFWRDEAFTWILAKRNIFDLFILTAKDFNPPLYYLIVHFWMKIFGSSEVILRSISFIMYWTTVYVIYLFLTNILKITGKKIWLYLVFIAINPVLLYYAFEARMYTMLAFFAILSLYAFIKSDYRKYVIATVLGLYTHYFMLLVLFAEILFYVATYRQRVTRLMIIKYLFPLFLFIPWIIFVLKVNTTATNSFWIDNTTLIIVIQSLGIIYTGYESIFKFYDTYITPLSFGLFFLILFGLFHFHKKHSVSRKLFWYLFIWSIGIPLFVMIISVFKPLFLPRYLIVSSIGISILIVYILDQLPSSVRYGLLLVFFLITFSYHTSQIKERQKSDLRTTIKQIKSLADKNDVLYVTNELNFFAGQYYFDENRVYIYGKNYDEIPSYVGKVLMPKEKFASFLPIYPRKAFVLNTDSHFEIQAAR